MSGDTLHYYSESGHPADPDRGPYYYASENQPEKTSGASGRMPWILFFLTVVSTILAGTIQQGLNPFGEPFNFIYGIPFAFTLLLILGVHESGHYLMCRIHRVPATVPYFIPIPNILGTLGAFIKIKGAIPNRRALLDIGMAGPLAGFMFALPAMVIGLLLSTPVPHFHAEGLSVGHSLLSWILERVVFPDLPSGFEIVLHPVAFAGYIGLLVTALNLLPVSQLDGGHIASALFGQKQWIMGRYFLFILFLLGFLWRGWWFWLFFIVLMGYRHPVMRQDARTLGATRMKWAWLTVAIFFLTFVPVPFTF
ncbi:site-2 protease family protein [bacterium]|nr:site-2 protease family protein [candidate division CSSED10-310 bacterium]